jgi:hypothetical protein
MSQKFPVGELFPDDDLAPVTVESVRYVYQLKRVNRVVIGLQELDASLGAKIEVATGLLGPVNSNLAETLRALEANAAELAAQRARQEELIATVKMLEARLPDPTKVRHEIQGDLWQMTRDYALDDLKEMEETLHAAAREAAAKFIESCTRGYIGPERPADGSPLRDRLIYLRDLFIFHGRKLVAAVTRLIGVAAIVLLVAERIFHIPL